jgi:hypothetical protein
MPLIKNGRLTQERYVRVLDDTPIPDRVPVIVPAARFLADADEILRRDAPNGVEWPNNRAVVELEPYLDRLAVIVLTFPNFKDGPATARPGCCGSAMGSSASCAPPARSCATSSCSWCAPASMRWKS